MPLGHVRDHASGLHAVEGAHGAEHEATLLVPVLDLVLGHRERLHGGERLRARLREHLLQDLGGQDRRAVHLERRHAADLLELERHAVSRLQRLHVRVDVLEQARLQQHVEVRRQIGATDHRPGGSSAIEELGLGRHAWPVARSSVATSSHKNFSSASSSSSSSSARDPSEAQVEEAAAAAAAAATAAQPPAAASASKRGGRPRRRDAHDHAGHAAFPT